MTVTDKTYEKLIAIVEKVLNIERDKVHRRLGSGTLNGSPRGASSNPGSPR
jgi:hypothetical protein